MKKYIAVVIMYCALSILACQDTHEELEDITSNLEYYRAVGEEIPFETGLQWIEFYKKQNQSGRTSILAPYSVSDDQLEAMMQSVTNLTGFAFHYATDSWGVQHIIAIPIDQSLSIWASIPGRILIDANTGNPISLSTAQTWAQNYKNAHPNDVWFHYFGVEVFNDILALPFFNSFDIEPAIDILNLTPEMLLVVWNDLGGLLGRTEDHGGGGGGCIYDASNPCPPCGVK